MEEESVEGSEVTQGGESDIEENVIDVKPMETVRKAAKEAERRKWQKIRKGQDLKPLKTALMLKHTTIEGWPNRETHKPNQRDNDGGRPSKHSSALAGMQERVKEKSRRPKNWRLRKGRHDQHQKTGAQGQVKKVLT
ncbi:hypothetical protein NDU88_006385 [Pleurodeles waltl]|uniref:Uncharacterized protein n=1 Tax=Pleurodeles waltl TaxID=8319 RepID=A0AAV7MM56_PLEWA|nr:hypothetical protein NDU88_006385 [Pleurodeles waltl]